MTANGKGQWQWFRFYHETMRDRKVRTLTHAEFRLWAAVQACASESPIRGLLRTPDGPADAAYLADLAGVSKKCATEGIAKFAAPERRMLTWCDEMACWQVRQWDKRQFESDSSTERTRAWRERHKPSTGDVPGDVPVTARGTRTENREQRTDLGSYDGANTSSPLGGGQDSKIEPSTHTEALRKLARRDMDDRNRECPDARPIDIEFSWLLKAMQRRRIEYAHVMARVSPDLDAEAIIDEIDNDKPNRKRKRDWSCDTCEGSSMVAADDAETVWTFCPECHPRGRKTA